MEPSLATQLRPMLGDLRQLASVRRVVLEDGVEAGTRAVAFSTGGGLDFWLLADRALDIGPLWWRGIPLAWQAPHGFVHPALRHPDSDGGRGFERAVSGFLHSCGLDHVRQPAEGRPLHGRLPLTPARLLSCGEDWSGPQPMLYAEGETVQSRLGGECLRLHRRIEAAVGGRELRIIDTVRNDAAAAQEHDLLYHFNLGYPAIADGSTVSVGGVPACEPLKLADTSARPEVVCHPIAPERADCSVETHLAGGGRLHIRFDLGAAPLHYVQLWRDLRPNCGLLAVEPCVSPWREGGGSGDRPTLAPGESRTYRVRVSFGDSSS